LQICLHYSTVSVKVNKPNVGGRTTTGWELENEENAFTAQTSGDTGRGGVVCLADTNVPYPARAEHLKTLRQ
jgi:hypothetical protein